jgi:hypothetical protein
VISPYSCHRLITKTEDILGRTVLHRNWEVNWAESAEPSTFQHKKLSKRLSGSDDASRAKICDNLKPLSLGGYGVQILEQKFTVRSQATPMQENRERSFIEHPSN